MQLGLGLGLTTQRGRSDPPIITATSAPVLAPLEAGATIASAYTAGVYASSAGTISSAVATYLLNGSSVAASTVVAEGDTVAVSVLVTDSAGNTRTFSAGTQAVTYVAPTISGLQDLSASYGASISINAALMASGSNLVYSLTGPSWLSISPSTGMITGTAPEADFTGTATVTVTNPGGSASDTFAVMVSGDTAEVTISPEADGTVVIHLPTGAASLPIVVTSEPWASRGTWPVIVARTALEAGPVNLVPPVVTGSADVGETLTADGGLWIYA
ncbi:putative Ig domain-containing protein, partial [Cereibacter ovatus]